MDIIINSGDKFMRINIIILACILVAGFSKS